MTLMSMAARMRPIATSTRMAVGVSVIALSLAEQAWLRSGRRSYLHGDAR